MKHLFVALLFVGALGVDRTLSESISQAPSPLFQKGFPSTPYQVDLNSASLEELKVLPSIGSSRALQILLQRKRQGPFQSLEDLKKIPGIGPKSLAKIAPLVMVSHQNKE